MNLYLNEYKNYLCDIKRVSDNTFDSYIRDIEFFLSYKNSKSIPTQKDFDDYIAHLYSCGKGASTILRTSSSIKSYYNYLYSQNKIGFTLKTSVKAKKQEYTPVVLSESEIELLLDAPERDTLKGIRDRAILEVFYATGIKVSELISLKTEDCYLKLNYLVLHTNSSERILPIYDRAAHSLSLYIDKARKYIDNGTSSALFLNLNGSKLTRQGIWKIIKSYAGSIKPGIEITPEIIRNSFAIHLIENGAQSSDLQEIMGLGDLSSANRYTELFKSRFAKKYNKFHPMAKK